MCDCIYFRVTLNNLFPTGQLEGTREIPAYCVPEGLPWLYFKCTLELLDSSIHLAYSYCFPVLGTSDRTALRQGDR